MNTKHTPGPWRANKSQGGYWAIYHGKAGNMVAGLGNLLGNAEANARLIAAAPELLDICERLNAYNALMVSAVDRAALRAAIAKATGETI